MPLYVTPEASEVQADTSGMTNSSGSDVQQVLSDLDWAIDGGIRKALLSSEGCFVYVEDGEVLTKQ